MKAEDVGIEPLQYRDRISCKTITLRPRYSGLYGTRNRFYRATTDKDNPYPNRPNFQHVKEHKKQKTRLILIQSGFFVICFIIVIKTYPTEHSISSSTAHNKATNASATNMSSTFFMTINF